MQGALDALRRSLAALEDGSLGAQNFSHAAREQTELLTALPARYGEVLLHLLDRLESSALFSEESCSFSQKDLIDSLRLWLDKAEAQLQRG